MPEKGWRKRLQEKRPKTPLQIQVGADDVAAAEPTPTFAERVRTPNADKLGWRRTYHGSRPETPSAGAPAPFLGDDTEDSRSEVGSDVTSGRGRSATKPKFSRYFSEYLSLTAPKMPEFSFSEPWNDAHPYEMEPPVDPLMAVQQIRSHIGVRGWIPLPVEYNCGILRVFEDYRKVREEKERLDALMKETLDGYKTDLETWEASEGRYREEIRRLELIIAHGTSGMIGLMNARQGSVLNRTRARRHTPSAGRSQTDYGALTRDQLDDQIRAQSQKVIYHRPASPSAKMAALSSKFSTTDMSEELPIGTPPDGSQHMTLSRKVKSELDLLELSKPTDTAHSDTYSGSMSSEWSLNAVQSSYRPHGHADHELDLGIECEAFVALRELATLVARRRGINTEQFTDRLMRLYSTGDDDSTADKRATLPVPEIGAGRYTLAGSDDGDTPRPTDHSLRRFRSQPQLNRRRHFSFEPGDDELRELNEMLKDYEVNRPKSPAGSQSTKSSEGGDYSAGVSSRTLSRAQTLGAGSEKPSKIPSPVSLPSMGRARRENSISSLKTVSSRYQTEEGLTSRNSRSSIRTAFRTQSRVSLRGQHSASRSSSLHNLQQAESELAPLSVVNNKPQTSMVALAAARTASATVRSAADPDSQSQVHPFDDPSRMSPTRKSEDTNPEKSILSENDTPQRHG